MVIYSSKFPEGHWKKCSFNMAIIFIISTFSRCIFKTVLRVWLYEAGWPVTELARQQRSPGLYERFDSALSLNQPR